MFLSQTPGALKFFESRTKQPDPQPDRRIVTGPDKLQYYTDTQERVLPGVEAPAPMEMDATPDIKGESGLRKEYNDLSKDFKKVKSAFSRIKAASDSAAGDIALIFNYMKMLDPGSVVRESEYATAANAAGVPDRIRVFYNKLVAGEKLSPAQRSMFKAEAELQYSSATGQQGEREAYFSSLATDYGFAPSRIVRNLTGANFAAMTQEQHLARAQTLTPEQRAQAADEWDRLFGGKQ